jgi:rod shape determining protein RodA
MEVSMRVEERTFFKKIDLNFVLVILSLNIIGLINVFSATHNVHSKDVNDLFIQQIVWLFLGWSGFFITTFVDYQIFFRFAPLAYILNVAALAYTTLFGKVSLGAQRWIDLGFFRYQPSETMKLALILMMARWLVGRSAEGGGMGLKELIMPAILILIPFSFIVEQPDLGTALMIMVIGGSLILFCRVKRKILIFATLGGLIAAPVGWHFGLREYQKNRVLTFLTPTLDPRGSGYNSIQSKIAVGSGRFLGKGFRKGTQSQLEFLPERHTDFIYSVLSEEHGFIGSVTTIGMFAILFIFGLRIASNARDKFGALMTIGVLCYIFWHMFINIGMVIGLLPIVGVPLPLLSYGGSSMMTTMIGLGIVSSVAYRRYLF